MSGQNCDQHTRPEPTWTGDYSDDDGYQPQIPCSTWATVFGLGVLLVLVAIIGFTT